MKQKIWIATAALCSIMLSSCLKDTPFMDVSNTSAVVEFGQSPAQGVSGPFVYAGDTTTTTDTAIALVLASPQPSADTLQVIVGIDTSQLSAYNSSNESSFFMLPANLYSISDTVNILPGYRVGRIPVTLKFPGLRNYALPLKIEQSYFLHGSAPVIISGNSGTFMWLFQ